MYDNNAILSALATKTATFNGTGLNTGTGSAPRGWKVRFRATYSVATTGTAACTFQPQIDLSADNTTWRTAAVQGTVLTATTTAQNHVSTLAVGENPSEPYIRFSLLASTGGSTTPQCICAADLGDARAVPEG